MQQKLVVFVSLILDLLAFTLILPLFPKIFDLYASNEHDDTYKLMQYWVDNFRRLIGVPDASSSVRGGSINSVLFGGAIGSLFSLLQFVSSTLFGAISDIYGRKRVLLLALVGTLISHIIWSMSSVFVVFLISRILGGIFKANVSICIAIMTDISANKDRSSTMALVGIAFSIGFLVGPCIGAVFSSMLSASSAVYIYPSYMAIGLTAINILFVAKFYEETLPVEKRAQSFTNNFGQALQFINPVSLFRFAPVKSVKEADLAVLKQVGSAYFIYLFIYSGMEFTLTFLVHNRFHYDSVQQGKMFFFIGICMTLVQGGYVRRIKQGTHIFACIRAIFVLIPAFVVIALAMDALVFYAGLLLYCYSSAVVTQSFTTFISHYGNDDEKGTITGISRSIGALARAFGPISLSIVYWTFGPTFAYIMGAIGLVVPLCLLIRVERSKIKLL